MEAVTTRQPEWDAEDRALIYGLLDMQADTHSCGHPLSETLQYKPGDEPEGYIKPEYQGDTRVCLACLKLSEHTQAWDDHDEKLREQKKPTHPGARIVTVTRTN